MKEETIEKILTLSMLSFFVLFLLVIIGGTAHMIYANKAMDNACKDLGYNKYYPTKDFHMCEDYDKNLHLVSANCSGFLKVNCTCKNIKIGEFVDEYKNYYVYLNTLNNSAMKGGIKEK